MKKILFIVCLLVVVIKYDCVFAQKKSSKNTNVSSRADSIHAANLLKKEALIKRQDSIYEARELAKEKRAQELEERNEKLALKRSKKILPLTQEMALGYRFATDGWSIFTSRGFIKTEDVEIPHTNFLWIDLSEKHNPKETNSYNETFVAMFPNEVKPVSYKYGKINNFYQLKIGYGNIKPISGILDRKNVIVNWVYCAGLSLGLLKPYYLDLFLPEGSGYIRKYAKYTETNSPYFLDLKNQGYIIGGADFTKGIAEIKMKPGLALRSGFFFDYSASRKTFMGIEIGASAEIYAQEIPIMTLTKNTAYFFNLYADFRFGKRWE